MRIREAIWLPEIVDKLAHKHSVQVQEVEELLVNRPKFHFSQRGDTEGEDVYLALGQTDAGRYIAVVFIYKRNQDALILSARDMTIRERRWYGRK